MIRDIARAKREFWEKELASRLIRDDRRTPDVVDAEVLFKYWKRIELEANGAEIGEEGIDLGAFGFPPADEIQAVQTKPIVSSDECLMTTVFYDGKEVYHDEDCEVMIDASRIVVSYEDPDGVVNYEGTEVAPGHFILRAPERSGEATLHLIPGGRILDGFWKEGGYMGFWRIKVPA